MAFILGVSLHDLRHPWTDWDETLGMYRVDLEIMQRHSLDFRSEVQTRSGLEMI